MKQLIDRLTLSFIFLAILILIVLSFRYCERDYEGIFAISLLSSLFLAFMALMWRGILNKRILGPLNKLGHDIRNAFYGEITYREDSCFIDEIQEIGAGIGVLTEELKSYKKHIGKRDDSILGRERAHEIEKNLLKERIINEQMRRSAMSELVVNIAHQWRQPLNNVGILAQDIEDMYHFGELNKESLERNVKQIMEQIQGLSLIISKFTGFYDKKDQLEEFTLYEVTQRAISLFEAGIGLVDIEIVLSMESQLSIYNNPQAFEEILMMLLVNAKEALEVASKEHGKIYISAKMAHAEESHKNEGIVLELEDNAGGIPQHLLHRVFDPYFTTKFESQGVGLGLYMARDIIENRMQGSISVQNGSKGACFTLSFPNIKAIKEESFLL